MKLKNETFIFEFAVEAVPHTKKTAEEIYGKGAYESGKFGIQSHASDIGYEILKDAYTHNMLAITKHLAQCKCEFDQMTPEQKRFYNYLERKAGATKLAMDTFKFSRMEK